jgi:hypothetical protein
MDFGLLKGSVYFCHPEKFRAHRQAMWKKRLIKLLLIAVAAVVIYIIFVSSFHYSEGSRTGYLSKFTQKGYVFKTYEGEIFVGGATADNSTIINSVWIFSVKSGDQAVIDSLRKYEGHIVKAHYYQVLKNMPWQGDTEYFVNKVEFVRDK